MKEEKDVIILGQRLKELREEKGMTQRQLAEVFHINSVTYLHYEKSQREPPLALLVGFARFYDVSVDYLLGLKD
ncbi:MAG: helix-turn-helix domain-containing protein [Christensenellaceae bacterium]